MKKFLALLLAMVFCLSMIACSSSNGFDEDEDEDEDEEQSEKENGDLQKVTVETQVVYDQDGYKVTVKSLDFDGFMGPALKLAIENNSSVNTTVSISDISINNVMVNAYFSAEVNAGKKANDELSISQNNLEAADITVIQKIEFRLQFSDPETYDSIAVSDVITVTTSADPSYVQKYNDTGVVIHNDDNIRVVVQKLQHNDNFGETEILVFIENKSGRTLTVQTEDVSLNGYMISPLFSCGVLPGKVAYASIAFLDTSLEENNITEIETMEFVLRIIDFEEYSNTYSSDPITVNFPLSAE